MASLRELIARLHDRLRRTQLEAELHEEMQFHLGMLERDARASGADVPTARASARRRFGGAMRVTEAVRDVWTFAWLDDLAQDVRFTGRSLARVPGWTAAVLAMITLGVAATAVVYTVVHALLLHPLAYPSPERIAVVRRSDSATQMMMSPNAEYVDVWRTNARSVEAVIAYGRRDVAIVRDGAQATASAALIDSGFFAFAGAHPIVGRNFSADELEAGGPGAVLLGESYWRHEFHAATNVVGTTLRVGDRVATVIGVLPALVQLPDVDLAPPDVWLPLIRSENARVAGVAVRVRSGTPWQRVEAEFDSIGSRAGIHGQGDGFHFTTKLLRPAETVRYANTLLMLSGAVALLLVVACSNVGHLMLVRGVAREREMAVRYALGAGRGRIVRQIITECLLLSAVGSAGALLLAIGALRLLLRAKPAGLGALSRVSMDLTVLYAAMAFVVLAGVAFGLLAGGRAVRAGLAAGLRSANGLTRAGRRLQAAFIVSEIALSAMLLVAAVTLVRGIIRLQTLDVGFDPHRMYALTMNWPASAESAAARDEFASALARRSHDIPGAVSATLAGSAPPKVTFIAGRFQAEGQPVPSGSPETVTADFVAPNYFAVTGLRLAMGRAFDARRPDTSEVVINEALAKQLWPASDALGKRFRVTDGTPQDRAPWLTVVGIARNAVMHGPLEERSAPAMFQPLAAGHRWGSRVTLIVRGGSGSAPLIVEALRRLGASMSADATSPRVVDVEQAMRDTFANSRFATQVVTVFAALAVVLAMVGLYAVISCVVAQRTREIGIRLTLGATRSTIARLVVGHGLALSGAGVTLGVAGALATGRAIEHSVDGIPASDAATFAVGAAILLVVSVAACVVPMARAAAVDPVIAIRAE